MNLVTKPSQLTSTFYPCAGMSSTRRCNLYLGKALSSLLSNDPFLSKQPPCNSSFACIKTKTQGLKQIQHDYPPTEKKSETESLEQPKLLRLTLY